MLSFLPALASTSADFFSGEIPVRKYQRIRKLKTNNADAIQFDIASNTSYKFGVAVMNNDTRNHIGSKIETLNFK